MSRTQDVWKGSVSIKFIYEDTNKQGVLFKVHMCDIEEAIKQQLRKILQASIA